MWECWQCSYTAIHGRYLARHLTEVHGEPTAALGPGGDYWPPGEPDLRALSERSGEG